jgi:hypothetical protein
LQKAGAYGPDGVRGARHPALACSTGRRRCSSCIISSNAPRGAVFQFILAAGTAASAAASWFRSADFDEVDSEWLCYFQPALPVRRSSLGYGEPFAIDWHHARSGGGQFQFPASIDVLEDPELRDLFETFWTAGKFAAADRMNLFKLGGNS